MLNIGKHLRALDSSQRQVVLASFLGWTLDAFDFFILVFVLKDIAREFSTSIPSVSIAIFLTLAARPVGAFLFGRAADRFGRRPVLMINILMFSALEFVSGLSTSLTMLIVFRTLYGVAMGGEWGVGASLTMESIPKEARGVVSGILQAGYPCGYLFASIVFFVLFPVIGWRGMFFVGALPALLVFYLRRNVQESPSFGTTQKADPAESVRRNIGMLVVVVLMMTAFNFFSHGTQDVYPTFLEEQRHYSSHVTGAIAIFYNIGAILGGIIFGALSQTIGRRRAIVIAALLVIPSAWLWVYAPGAVLLAIGAFLVQFFVQGAWGVVPVHLNELSPASIRGTFPGTAYQLGNLLASGNATIQTSLAAHWNGNYGRAMLVTMLITAVAVAAFSWFGPERKDHDFGGRSV